MFEQFIDMIVQTAAVEIADGTHRSRK